MTSESQLVKCPECELFIIDSLTGYHHLILENPCKLATTYVRKENRMKLLPKILRRVIVLWCVYGLYKGMSLLNPYVLFVMKYLEKHCDSHTHTNVENIVVGWLVVFGVIVIVCIVSFALHKFSAWLFNESKR